MDDNVPNTAAEPNTDKEPANDDTEEPTANIEEPNESNNNNNEVTVTTEVPCNVEKLEVEEINKIFPIKAHKLFEQLFTNEEFTRKVHNRRKDWDLVIAQWPSPVQEGQERQLSWQFTVSNPMVRLKQTVCQATQRILKYEENRCYAVDVHSRTPHLPYGDAFETHQRLCITAVGDNSCRLLVSLGIRWHKNPLIKCTR